jgi:hypothetical protein
MSFLLKSVKSHGDIQKAKLLIGFNYGGNRNIPYESGLNFAISNDMMFKEIT